MSKQIDFGEERNYRPTHSRGQSDSLGIAALLLRYRIVQTRRAAAQTSKLIMLGIVLVSIITMLTLWLSNRSADAIPEDAYFDPTIHNADDEPI